MNKIQCPKGHYYDADMFSECPHCKRKSESKTEVIPPRLKDGIKDASKKLWHVSEPPADQAEKTVALQAQEVSGSSEEKTVGFFERLQYGDSKNDSTAAETKQAESRSQHLETPVPEADSEKTQILMNAHQKEQAEPEPDGEAEPALKKEPPQQAADPIVGWLVCIQGIRYGECFTINAGKNSIGRGAENRIRIAGDVQVSRSQHAYIIYEPRSRKFFLQPGNSSGLTYLNHQLVLLPEALKERDEIGLNESRFLFIPLCNESFSWEPSL